MMDALSSSFLSTSPHTNNNNNNNLTTIINKIIKPSSPLLHLIPNLNHQTTIIINSSIRNIEPKTTTTTSTDHDHQYKKTSSQNNASSSASSNKPHHLPTIIFTAFDDMINNFIDPPLRPSFDPKFVLSHNFAPVDELPPTPCEVISGTLPPCLDGAYIRNGPNPQFHPRGPYHMFDGDGMLHSVRISKGEATLCSRYVETYKYTVERHAGCPVLPNFFSAFHGVRSMIARGALTAAKVITGQYNPFANGFGPANTSVAYFGDRLYALGESDLPYAIRLASDGDIETIGRHDFDGELSKSMTAHPKIDPDTGEVFGFRYGPMRPYLSYFRFDSNGNKLGPDVPILSMVNPPFIHDFAITKKYAVFPDIQISMNLTNLLKTIIGRGGGGGGEEWSPVSSDPQKMPRIGVIPRYAKDDSEMRWFDVPGFNIIHAINAWDDEEEEDVIVMVAPNVVPVEHTLHRVDLVHASVEKVRIDLKTGTVSRTTLSALNLDFGVINPAYVGKKNKYVYAAVGDPMPCISGIVKLDVSKGAGECNECTVASRMYGDGCYGGEPFFVAAEEAEEEDDGYVVTFVHDENSGESRFLVMDAKSPDLEIVAAVKLPRRVPYGFHGLFVKENDLNKLYKTDLHVGHSPDN